MARPRPRKGDEADGDARRGAEDASGLVYPRRRAGTTASTQADVSNYISSTAWQPPPGVVSAPAQQTQPGSCSSIPTCDSCLQSADRATFVCCCDAACATWNPATQQGQVAGFLGCCSDYARVCAAAAGR